MREEFTGQLRLALERAQSVARELNQEYVGVEHLLLGLLDCAGCEAAYALCRSTISGDELRRRLTGALPRGDEAPGVSGNLPLSPKAMRAVNGAVNKAQAEREPRVSTRLVLAALLEQEQGDRPQDSLALQGLRDAGADVEQLRRLLDQPAEAGEE